jgi:hypothetical protein
MRPGLRGIPRPGAVTLLLRPSERAAGAAFVEFREHMVDQSLGARHDESAAFATGTARKSRLNCAWYHGLRLEQEGTALRWA